MFEYTDWLDRIKKRSDITGMLTHLTKPIHEPSTLDQKCITQESVKTLIKILQDRTIVGSTTKSGYIIGDKPAVCFQDAPLYGIIQNIENERLYSKAIKSKKVRYTGNGLLFSKYYVYGKGGRPVIYDDSAEAKKYIDPSQHWRIVNLKLLTKDNITIDWTHEREWRLAGNFDFIYENTHVVVEDKYAYDYFVDNCSDEILEQIHGITILRSLLM